MDSLALLCNLYGDGPTSLRRLREAGYGTLEAVATLEPEKLAGLLRTSVRAARRFQSEARLLGARLESVPLPARAAPARESSSDPLLRKVLAAWRERDRSEFPPPTGERPSGSPPPPAPPEGELLRAGLLEGLDLGWCGRLARTGVRTLEELARCDAFALGREADLPYTRVLRLQQSARRRLSPGDSAARSASKTLWPRPPAPREKPPGDLVESGSSLAKAGVQRFSPADEPPQEGALAIESGLETRATAGGAVGGPNQTEAVYAPLDGAGPFA